MSGMLRKARAIEASEGALHPATCLDCDQSCPILILPQEHGRVALPRMPGATRQVTVSVSAFIGSRQVCTPAILSVASVTRIARLTYAL